MPFTQSLPWILLLALLLVHSIFLPKLFRKAGFTDWHGYVPGLNYWTWLKVIGRPWYWILLLVIPGINLVILTIMQVELGIGFNQRSTVQQWKMGALAWFFIPQLSMGDEAFLGKRDWTKKKKSAIRDWSESILWALVVATIVRAFIFEAFTIPTASMEGSMLVGDYLYVSKTAYGAKVPQTPVSIPLIHNVIPGGMTPSYLEWFALPFTRLPGIRNVERYDAVVFNFPHGDTIVVDPNLSGHDYYGILRREGIASAQGSIETYLQDPSRFNAQARSRLAKRYGIKGRPLDKTENYVKRCVGLPGETIGVVDGVLQINGEAITPPAGVQYEYIVTFKSQLDARRAIAGLDLTNVDLGAAKMNGDAVEVTMALTQSEVDILGNGDLAKSVIRMDVSSRRGSLEMFPNVSSEEFDQWDPDNLGPIQLPHQNMTVPLNKRNLSLYRRAIVTYEGHTLEERDGNIYIDGEITDSYTFGLDYYWMMGDNRHRSADSRMWGFVPQTHVVGHASFIWFSKQNEAQHGESKIRWDRMFQSVK
jgi:signal peptidase I